MPCRTIITGSLPFTPPGATISTGTRSTVPSAFFSLANDHRDTTHLPFSTGLASSRTSIGTFGRSSNFSSAAFAFSGGSTFSWAASGARPPQAMSKRGRASRMASSG